MDHYEPTSSYDNTVALYGPSVDGQRGELIEYYKPEGDRRMMLGPHTLEPGRYTIRVYTAYAPGDSRQDRYTLAVTDGP